MLEGWRKAQEKKKKEQAKRVAKKRAILKSKGMSDADAQKKIEEDGGKKWLKKRGVGRYGHHFV